MLNTHPTIALGLDFLRAFGSSCQTGLWEETKVKLSIENYRRFTGHGDIFSSCGSLSISSASGRSLFLSDFVLSFQCRSVLGVYCLEGRITFILLLSVLLDGF